MAFLQQDFEGKAMAVVSRSAVKRRSWTTKALLFMASLSSTTFLVSSSSFNQYTKEDLIVYREEVRDMFQHAYDSYLTYAYPYDELRPLSCDGVDTWGSYSLTLVDALDTLAVIGNYSEFVRVYEIISQRTDFDANINVSVFETNIRIVGGLLSAHLFAKKAGAPLEEGWPCNGPLLRLAEDAVKRLLPAFDTPTGMPYGTVNLRYGVPEGETPVTCTAGVGTYIIEFGTLSRLTGNPLYEETAMRALRSIHNSYSSLGLPGNHIDVLKGKWTAVEAGIGAGVDSYYEYLVKGASLLQRPELMHMFNRGREAIDRYLNKDDWYFWVNMKTGQVTMPLFQNLEAFWPGTLSLTGDIEAALKSLHNYHQVWKQYGFTPEFYNVAQNGVAANREGYPLRPELIESIMYLYRATGDPWLIEAGVDILRSIQHSAYTPCGYATVKNVKTHSLEDRMESFFLAETTKYLYLLFDQDNFIHNPGTHADVHEVDGGRCLLDAGGYIFNSEAHPVDPAALACCSRLSEKEVQEEISLHMIDILNPHKVQEFRGDLVPERIKKINLKLEDEMREKKERDAEIRLKMELIKEQAEAFRLKQKQEQEALKLQEEEEAADEGEDDGNGDHVGHHEEDDISQHVQSTSEKGNQEVSPDDGGVYLDQVSESLDKEQEGVDKEPKEGEIMSEPQMAAKTARSGNIENNLEVKAVELASSDQGQGSRTGDEQKLRTEESRFDINQQKGSVVSAHGDQAGVEEQDSSEEIKGVGTVEDVTAEVHRHRVQERREVVQEDQELTKEDSGRDTVAQKDNQGMMESNEKSPQFSKEKSSKDKLKKDDNWSEFVSNMIQKLSRGEYLSQAETGGIVQPAKMPNVFEDKRNLVVEAINNLVESFLPSAAAEFDLEKFTMKVKSSMPVNSSWVDDYGVLSCAAQKFTDRFLLHGEFFETN